MNIEAFAYVFVFRTEVAFPIRLSCVCCAFQFQYQKYSISNLCILLKFVDISNRQIFGFIFYHNFVFTKKTTTKLEIETNKEHLNTSLIFLVGLQFMFILGIFGSISNICLVYPMMITLYKFIDISIKVLLN